MSLPKISYIEKSTPKLVMSTGGARDEAADEVDSMRDITGDLKKYLNANLQILLNTGNASRNNVPNKRLLSGTFLCVVLGTLRSKFCIPDTVCDVPDVIWNIIPNIIRHIFLIPDFGS